jgi:uncharacterized LabA/DUF88 family protein
MDAMCDNCTMAERNKYAFIDAQNVYMGTRAAGWTIDAFKLRIYLSDKYHVRKALWFVGYLPEMQGFYTLLQKAGFIVVLKEVARDRGGMPKGNVDVDLTLYAVDLEDEYDTAVLLTSDGDFASLVRHLKEREKLEVVLSPHRANTSRLLRRAAGTGKLEYLEAVRSKIGRTK